MSEELIQEQSHPNLLSIDFNFIMWPCIKLYHDLTNEKEGSVINWSFIEQVRGLDKCFLQYDAKSYCKIVKLIQKYTEQGAKLYKTDKHSQCVNYFTDENIKYNLYNIDFYHDIMINQKDRNNIMKFNKYDSSNWVGYLLLKDKINSYTWIRFPNSISYDTRLNGIYDIRFNEEFLTNMITNNTIPESIDTIVINFPSHQVPYEYKHLYDLIFDLFRKEE